MDAIERVNWLAHRWPIKLRTQDYGGYKIYTAEIAGQRVGQQTSREAYDHWVAQQRPMCLARQIAQHPALHPPAAIIVDDRYRIARIPPELWCGYDTVHLVDLPSLTLLSAKVRAMYPAWPKALIRVVRRDALGALGLVPAPSNRAGHLRLVS